MTYNPFSGTSPAAYTPGMSAHFATGQSDGAYEDLEREAGSYQAGSMEKLTDQIEQGSDDEP